MIGWGLFSLKSVSRADALDDRELAYPRKGRERVFQGEGRANVKPSGQTARQLIVEDKELKELV